MSQRSLPVEQRHPDEAFPADERLASGEEDFYESGRVEVGPLGPCLAVVILPRKKGLPAFASHGNAMVGGLEEKLSAARAKCGGARTKLFVAGVGYDGNMEEQDREYVLTCALRAGFRRPQITINWFSYEQDNSMSLTVDVDSREVRCFVYSQA